MANTGCKIKCMVENYLHLQSNFAQSNIAQSHCIKYMPKNPVIISLLNTLLFFAKIIKSYFIFSL